jgi:hypothetical protein
VIVAVFLIHSPIHLTFFMTGFGLRTGSQSPHPKSKFTPEEDSTLINLVREHGTDDWPHIARLMRGRNARQCKDRWFNFLSPDVVNGPWTEEEEALLCNRFAMLGNLWKLISTFFPGRTEINVKSHWQLMQRRIKREMSHPRLPAIPKRPAPPPPPPLPKNPELPEIFDLDEMPLFSAESCEYDFDIW